MVGPRLPGQGRESLAYLGQQLIRYVPIKAEIEVNLGPDDLVVYETLKSSTERLNFSYRRGANGQEWVNGWDEKTAWIDTIRNYRPNRSPSSSVASGTGTWITPAR